MTTTLAPLCRVIEVLSQELVRADEQFECLVAADPTIKRLTSVPNIGPITASAFVAALDVADRFERASQVTSYLGLVPQEYSSGERHRRGRLLRSAHPQLQSLLVLAAWRISRSADPKTAMAGVGRSDYTSTWQEGRDGRARAPPGSPIICDVA